MRRLPPSPVAAVRMNITLSGLDALERDIDSMPPDCPQHPRYKAIQKPRVDCAPCWATYNWVHCEDCTNEKLCARHNPEVS